MEDLDLPKFEKIVKKTKKVINRYQYDTEQYWPVSNKDEQKRKGKNDKKAFHPA